jgi:hypothetical protein
MTAVSFSLSRGVDGFKMSDVTVGSNAPSSGDVELRFNVTDTNGKNMNALDIYASSSPSKCGSLMVEAACRAIS